MSSEKHIAVISFPFTSHAWAIANLLLKLATAAPDVHFSFLNTAKSNGLIFPPQSRAKLPNNIRVYDVSDGLPDSHHGPIEHWGEHVDLFLKVAPKNFGETVDTVEQDVRKKVSCLLTDALMIFGSEMAEKMQVPWVALWVPAPQCLAAHVYIDVISELLRESSGGDTSIDDDNDDDKSLGVIPGLSMMRISDISKELIDDQDTSRRACMLREVGMCSHVAPPLSS